MWNVINDAAGWVLMLVVCAVCVYTISEILGWNHALRGWSVQRQTRKERKRKIKEANKLVEKMLKLTTQMKEWGDRERERAIANARAAGVSELEIAADLAGLTGRGGQLIEFDQYGNAINPPPDVPKEILEAIGAEVRVKMMERSCGNPAHDHITYPITGVKEHEELEMARLKNGSNPLATKGKVTRHDH